MVNISTNINKHNEQLPLISNYWKPYTDVFQWGTVLVKVL